MIYRIFQVSTRLSNKFNFKNYHRINQHFQSYAIWTSGVLGPKIPRKNFEHLPLIFRYKTGQLLIPNSNFVTQSKETEQKGKQLNVGNILSRIDRQFKQQGYIPAEWLQKLLDQLESQSNTFNEILTMEQITFLLSSCCPDLMPNQNVGERLDYFQRLWEVLAANDKITSEHFLIKLKVLKENEISLPDHKLFIKQVVENCNNVNESALYDKLLEVACNSGKITQAAELILEMREKNFALSTKNFNTLILGHARAKDLEGIKKVLDNMMATGLSVSIETQSVLVLGYLENEQPEKSLEILDKYKGQFDPKHICNFFRSALKVKLDKELIERLIQELPKNLLVGSEVPVVLRNVCIELLRNKRWETVKAIVKSLPCPVFTENQNNDTFCVFLLNELIRIHTHASEVIEFAKYLKESGKNTRALHIATEMAMKKSPPLGLPYLEALSKEDSLRPHYFWPLMMYNFRRHGESGILRTLSIMAQYDLVSDAETFKDYVLPRLSIFLENPQKALKIFNEIGVKTSTVLTPLVATLLMQQKIQETLDILELYPSKLQVNELIDPLVGLAVHVRVTKNYHLYGKLVSEILKKADNRKMDYGGLLLCEIFGPRSKLRSDITVAKRFVTEMLKNGILISPSARDSVEGVLKESFQNQSDFVQISHLLEKMSNRSLTALNTGENLNQSSFVKHPRDMNLDELEFHLVELESKQMNTRGLLRRLLQMCVRENRIERALKIKEKCDELKVETSPGMLASILDLYIKLQDLSKAEECLKNLQRTYPAFQIDEHKEIDLASLYVKENQYDRAIKMLEERAEKHKIFGGEYVSKNIWQFLNNVAHYSTRIEPALPPEENLTRNTFNFLNKLNYCRSNNMVLGPIIREWLLRGNITAAVEELRYFAKQYRHTPLQYELMSVLIRLSNAEHDVDEFYSLTRKEAQHLLQEVTAIVSSVHGTTNMNSSLLLAFAENGTDNQLRRILMNPEFRINEELLIKNCEHLSQEGAITTLLRLAKGSRGINRIIDEQHIHRMLLDRFVRENNFTGALALYERLETDDELKVSQEFLKDLVNLLKINKITIPSNIALRAQVV